MAASVFSSAMLGGLFTPGDVGRLWSDNAEVRAMLLVEGALARVQGAQGVIPADSAAYIDRSSREVQIDPGGLAAATARNGVSVPAVIDAFRTAMEAPDHAQYVHWGATSQDIIDTALMLRLRQSLSVMEGILRDVLMAMARAARDHADTPLAARTYAQHATPTSWGATLAQWGAPLADAMDRLPALRPDALWVSLSGAAGTASALGTNAPAIRAALAETLNLNDPGRSWHTDRTPVLRIVDWMGAVVATLGGMGQGLIGLAASDVGEVRIGAAGGSSTMPQKQNPVAPSVIVALNHQMTGLRATLQVAGAHQHQRDGAAWFAEWMVLPQIALCTGGALTTARGLLGDIAPVPDRMAANLHEPGLIHAEALSFALCAHMPRVDAQAATKALVARAVAEGTSLRMLARAAYPDLPAHLFDPAAQMGQAPADARAFAARVAAL